MWDAQDHEGRWWQLLFGVLLLLVALFFGWLSWHHYSSGSFPYRFDNSSYSGYTEDGIAFGAAYLGIRCLWYVITGEDNINRDDF